MLSILPSLPLEEQTSEGGDRVRNLLARIPFPIQINPPFQFPIPRPFLPDSRRRFSLFNDRADEEISGEDLAEMISALSDLDDVADREDDDSQATAQLLLAASRKAKDLLDHYSILASNQVNAQSIAEAQKARFFKKVGRFFKDRVKPALKNGFNKVKDAFNDVIIPDILVPVARDVLQEGAKKALESVG